MNTQIAFNEEQAIQYILSMDFDRIINKLVDHMGWSKVHALEIAAMYRRFLILKKKYGQHHPLPPSEDIDEFWHMHILDTKRYRADCDKIFGYYLDHYPYLGIDETTNLDDLEKAFTTTQQLYAESFNGEPILEVRGRLTKIIGCLRTLFKNGAKRSTYIYDGEVTAIESMTSHGKPGTTQDQV